MNSKVKVSSTPAFTDRHVGQALSVLLTTAQTCSTLEPDLHTELQYPGAGPHTDLQYPGA